MGRFETRERGVTLKRLNLNALTSAVNNVLVATYGTEFNVTADTWEQFLGVFIFEDEDGRKYERYVVMNGEGVGYMSGVDNTCSVIYSVGFGSDTVKLGVNFLKSMTTDEEVDLADIIREFGQRLESNFWYWHRLMTRHQTADA